MLIKLYLLERITLKIDISKKIGKGYKTFWNFKGRYRVVKGGRASKKSTTNAQWIIYKMMQYPLANTLVIRIFVHYLECFFKPAPT